MLERYGHRVQPNKIDRSCSYIRKSLIDKNKSKNVASIFSNCGNEEQPFTKYNQGTI